VLCGAPVTDRTNSGDRSSSFTEIFSVIDLIVTTVSDGFRAARLKHGSNASIVVRRGLQPAPNHFNVHPPVRLQTGDQFRSSLLARALVGLGHWI
jgi:hypothetical protein